MCKRFYLLKCLQCFGGFTVLKVITELYSNIKGCYRF
uniref:Uncharacterized protein n=1 Tax=Ciona intestinalis TaxID=7719 RepID=H2XU99_CIOIN